MDLTIYTDGSSLGNPGPGGWAFLHEDGHEAGNAPYTTNNRMELTAVIKALEFAKKSHHNAHIRICTDSNLIVNTVTKHWKTKQNTDLWDQLFTLLDELDVIFIKVEAHKHDVLNNQVDELARGAARKIEKQQVAEAHESDPNTITCSKCGYSGIGLYGWMDDQSLIRVDCPKCRSFIAFAPHTKENLGLGRKRPLLTAHEVNSFYEKLKHAQKSISKKVLKTYTKEEITEILQS